MSVMPAANLVALQREAEAPLFVINLCASTTPVALTPPSTPELKRFNFFVTRQREDGRERFRLHMGYFATQEEAEVVLSAVRDVYPAAWSGPAPTNRAAAARSRAAAVAAAPSPVPPVVAAPEVPAAAFAAPAAPDAKADPAAASPAETPAVAEPVVPVASVAVVADAAVPVVAPAAPAGAAKRPAVRTRPAVTTAPAVKAAPAAAPEETLDAMSNVREVLAQLADEPPQAAHKARKPARAAAIPEAKPAPAAAVEKSASAALPAPKVDEPKPAAPASATPRPAAPKPAEAVQPVPKPAAPVLSAAQTLAVLEAKAPFAEPGREAAADIRVITPEDTQTLRDISLDAQNAAPPAYAVQLCWSVTPIDAESLPHLAIFDAYTLYNVEGSRQGRRWYGLRLGFFTDPDGARQVAHYVRSDYATVAVVPVTTRERDRASGNAPGEPSASGNYAAPLRSSGALPAQPEKLEAPRSDVFNGFELLQDDRPVAPKRDVDDVARVAGNPPVLKPALRPVSGAAKPAARPAGKRAVARKPRAVVPGAAQPLEETLEMLGASTLTLDESREIIREPLGRDTPKKPENGPGARFARLLTRLSSRG